MPSSLSIAITAAHANDAAADRRSLHETRSSGFRHKIHLRTSSPTATGTGNGNGRRKGLLSVSPEHTETTPSRLNFNKNRSRGSSGSSLLNPAVLITSPPQPAPVGPTAGALHTLSELAGGSEQLTVTSSSWSSEIIPQQTSAQAERPSAIEPESGSFGSLGSTDNHSSWPQACATTTQGDSGLGGNPNGSSVIRSHIAVRYLSHHPSLRFFTCIRAPMDAIMPVMESF
jgi:hypothetical protein